MRRYAENTGVAISKSKGDIETILIEHGAQGFMYGWNELDGVRIETLAFHMEDRQVKFLLPMPSRDDDEFWRTPSRGTKRSMKDALKYWEQACRQRWRALYLVIKAKIEAVKAEITTFEDEFLAHIMLPDGNTVGEFMKPQIGIAYDEGKMPKQLPLLDNKK